MTLDHQKITGEILDFLDEIKKIPSRISPSEEFVIINNYSHLCAALLADTNIERRNQIS